MPAWLETFVGLVTLIVGADLLVRGAVWVALTLGVRPMTVGLTLVAFGTSAPELVVCLEAASSGQPGMALGTVLGSNLANILLIVGLSASIRAIHVKASRLELNYLLLATALLAVPFLWNEEVSRVVGLALVATLGLFTAQLLLRERSSRAQLAAAGLSADKVEHGPGALVLHLLFLVGGLAGLKFGGDWLVNGASGIAAQFGMTPELIGMTIVAIGTSLPELATSVLAARKGHPEICIGNVIGSNIFNIGMVLGITGLAFPLPAPWADSGAAMVVGAAAAVVLVVLLRLRGGVPRPAGVLMVTAYVAYLTVEVLTKVE